MHSIGLHLRTCSACAYLQIRSDALGYCLIHHCPVPLLASACRAFRHPVAEWPGSRGSS